MRNKRKIQKQNNDLKPWISPLKIAINGLLSHISGQTCLEHPIFEADQVKIRIVVEHVSAKGAENWQRFFSFLREHSTHPGAALGCSSHRLPLFTATATFSKPEVH